MPRPYAADEMRTAAQTLRDVAPDLTGSLAGLADPVAEWLDVCAGYAEKWYDGAPTSPFQAAGLRVARIVNGTLNENSREDAEAP
jgi:hypothetical protein